MMFSISRDPADGSVLFRGAISERELAELMLSGLDRGLIDSIDNGESAASDWLLVLGVIYRRFEEQNRK